MPEIQISRDLRQGSALSSPVKYDIVGGSPAWLPLTRRRYLNPLPALALSLWVSTATVFGDRPRTLYLDSSVILGSQRPRWQRISLGEARKIALQAVWRDVERSRLAAQREAAEFTEWFDWK